MQPRLYNTGDREKKIYIHHLGSFGVLMSELLKVIIRTKV